MKKILLFLVMFFVGILGVIDASLAAGDPEYHDGSTLYTYDVDTNVCPGSNTHRNTHGIIIPDGVEQIDTVYIYFHGQGDPTIQKMCTEHGLCRNAAALKEFGQNIAIFVHGGRKASGDNKVMTLTETTCYTNSAIEKLGELKPGSTAQNIILVGHSAGVKEVMTYLSYHLPASKALLFDGCYGDWCASIASSGKPVFVYGSNANNETRNNTESLDRSVQRLIMTDLDHNEVREKCFLDHVTEDRCVAGQPPSPVVSSGGCHCMLNIKGLFCNIKDFPIVVPYGNLKLLDVFSQITSDEMIMGQLEDQCVLLSFLKDGDKEKYAGYGGILAFVEGMRGAGGVGDIELGVTQNECSAVGKGSGEYAGHTYNFNCSPTDVSPDFQPSSPPSTPTANSGGAPTTGGTKTSEKLKEVELINPIGGTISNPKGDFNLLTVLSRVLRFGVQIIGSLALLAFIIGGLLWLTSGGNEEKVKKGTDTMIWATIGVFIIFAAYAILALIIDSIV